MANFVAPTLEELTIYGSEIGLSETECEKAFFFYSSNGWRVGRTPMKNWHMALSGWYVRWRETQKRLPVNGANVVILGKEYERIIQRMKTIKETYGDHQYWDDRDKKEYTRLFDRRQALRKTLGITI